MNLKEFRDDIVKNTRIEDFHTTIDCIENWSSTDMNIDELKNMISLKMQVNEADNIIEEKYLKDEEDEDNEV